MAETRRRRRRATGDGLEADFGPGVGGAGKGAAPDSGGAGTDGVGGFPLFDGVPCGKDGCLLRPFAELLVRFGIELSRRGHSGSAGRAAAWGVELLRALRDFLDEEIALAERAAGKRKGAARYRRIRVE